MINATIIVSIHNLKLRKNTIFPLTENVTLSNDAKLINHIIQNDGVIKMLGINEINFILENETFIILKQSLDKDLELFDERESLAQTLNNIQILCQCFWLIKDNAIRSELGHLIYNSKNNNKTFLHTNLWSSSLSNCFGNNMESSEFDLEQLVMTKSAFSTITTSLYNDYNINKNAKLTSKQSRLNRAFYFLQSARQSEDIGTKIAHYCSVLESLFSLSNSELRHRLSETISFFLEQKMENRIEVYKKVQIAYDIRSSIVHGDGISEKYIKNDYKLLYEISENTDSIVRKCINEILRDDELILLFTEKSKVELSDYIQNLIFS